MVRKAVAATLGRCVSSLWTTTTTRSLASITPHADSPPPARRRKPRPPPSIPINPRGGTGLALSPPQPVSFQTGSSSLRIGNKQASLSQQIESTAGRHGRTARATIEDRAWISGADGSHVLSRDPRVFSRAIADAPHPRMLLWLYHKIRDENEVNMQHVVACMARGVRFLESIDPHDPTHVGTRRRLLSMMQDCINLGKQSMTLVFNIKQSVESKEIVSKRFSLGKDDAARSFASAPETFSLFLWAWAKSSIPLDTHFYPTLQTAIAHHAPDMEPTQLGATIWALAHFSPSVQLRRQVRGLVEAQLVTRAKDLQSSGVSIVLQSLGRAGWAVPVDVLRPLLDEASRHASDAYVSEVTATLLGVSDLWSKFPWVYQKPREGRHNAEDDVPADPAALKALATSIQVLCQKYEALLDKASRAGRCTLRDAAIVLHAFGVLGHVPRQQDLLASWARLLTPPVMPSPPRTGPLHQVDVLHEDTDASSSSSSPSPSSSMTGDKVSTSSSPPPALSTKPPPVAAPLRAVDISSVLPGLIAARYTPTPQEAQQWGTILGKQLLAYETHELTKLSEALEAWQKRHPTTHAAMMQGFTSYLAAYRARTGLVSGVRAASTLISLARLNLYPSAPLVDAYLLDVARDVTSAEQVGEQQSAKRSGETVDASTLRHVWYALGSLRHAPDAATYRALVSYVASRRRLAALSRQDLATMLWGMALVTPEAMLRNDQDLSSIHHRLVSSALLLLEKEVAKSKCLSPMACKEYATIAHVAAYWHGNRVAAPSSSSSPHVAMVKRVADALLAAHATQSYPRTDTNVRLMQEALAQWHQAHSLLASVMDEHHALVTPARQAAMDLHTPTVSARQRSVFQTLSNMLGVDAKGDKGDERLVLEFRTLDGVHTADIALHRSLLHRGDATTPSSSSSATSTPADWVLIEVDGPDHFTRNTKERLGIRDARNHVLRAQGYEVVQLGFEEWRDKRRLRNALQEILKMHEDA